MIAEEVRKMASEGRNPRVRTMQMRDRSFWSRAPWVDALSERHSGGPYGPMAIGTERVIRRILPERIHVRG